MSAESGTVEEAQPLRRTTDLMGFQVRVGDVALGRIRDVLVDIGSGELVGFVVKGRGARRYFLPSVTATVRADHVEVESALALLTANELAFYVDHAMSLEATMPESRGAVGS